MKLAEVIKSKVKDLYPIKQIVLQNRLKAEFSKELLLLAGKHNSNSSHQSILFFTLHKCASVYVTQILSELAEDVGITPINFEGYFWKSAKSPLTIEKEIKNAFKPIGYMYGPFRHINLWQEMKNLGGYRVIDDIESYKILLMLRDPRDVITSKYFSIAYSHYVPELRKEEILSRRENALKITVDEFVTDKKTMSGFLNTYNDYCKEILGRPNVLFVKYEDMVNEFETWIGSIVKFLELDVKQETLNKIINEANFSVEEENVYSHKRQVTPGDHKRKLKPESIDILNSEFSEVLDSLGYER